MSYSDNSKKFSCVINVNCPIPQLMNAITHCVAGLVSNMKNGLGDFLRYENDAEKFTALISRYPIIILKAKNGNQLSNLRQAAHEAGVLHNVFVSTMLGNSADDQMRNTKNASKEEIDYWVISLFGDSSIINPITKKFSVYTL